jgi:hypothetical protein
MFSLLHDYYSVVNATQSAKGSEKLTKTTPDKPAQTHPPNERPRRAVKTSTTPRTHSRVTTAFAMYVCQHTFINNYK